MEEITLGPDVTMQLWQMGKTLILGMIAGYQGFEIRIGDLLQLSYFITDKQWDFGMHAHCRACC